MTTQKTISLSTYYYRKNDIDNLFTNGNLTLTASKNLVTDSNGKITTENKLTIGTTASNAAAGNHTHDDYLTKNNANNIYQPKGDYLTEHQDISSKENINNKSSSITTDSGSTTKYPTVKAIEDYAQPKGNYLTETSASNTYQPKGNYLTEFNASNTYQPKGNYLTEHQDISEKEDRSNKVTNISSSSTNTQYPSAKAVYSYSQPKGDYLTQSDANNTYQPKGNYLTEHQDITGKSDINHTHETWTDVTTTHTDQSTTTGFGKLYVNTALKIAIFYWTGNHNFTNSSQKNINKIYSPYMPKHTIATSINYNPNNPITMRIYGESSENAGEVWYMASEAGSQNFGGNLIWHY